MGKMQLYDNKEIEWKECPGCEFANHSFNISCGIAYENDTLEIPERYKKMSVSELEKEKTKVLKEINVSDRPKKVIRKNKNNIVFRF